jgi:thiol-disulfide isomerase/thioredoxin
MILERTHLMKPAKRMKYFTSFAILLCLSLFLTSSFSVAAEKGSILESKILKIGADAPLFTCSSLSGEEFALEQYVGQKPVILFFWSFFCGPCRDEMPVLQGLYDELGAENVTFVGVNLDGDKLGKAITKFMADSNLSFTTVFDELNGLEYKIADPYGVAGTPTTYAIGMDGKVIFSTVGHLEPHELKKVIEQDISGT